MKKASGPDASNVPGPISIMLPFTTTKQQHENDGDVDMMSEDKVGGGTGGYVVVVPGDVITAEQGYLRGHGTHIENGQLIATGAFSSFIIKFYCFVSFFLHLLMVNW